MSRPRDLNLLSAVRRGLPGALLVAICALPSAASAAYPGANGIIAFQGPGPQGAGDQVWVVQPDGRAARSVTDSMFIGKASFSPDGLRLNYQGLGTNDALPVRTAPDGSVTFGDPVTTLSGGRQFGFGPLTWSPDESKIAATYYGGFGTPDFPPQGLYGIDVRIATENPTEIARQSTLLTQDGGVDPVWSPDGSSVAHTGCKYDDPAVCGLWLSRPSPGGETRRLLRQSDLPTPTSAIRSPDWSPDGKRLIFEIGQYRGAGAGLWSVRADGTGLQQVVKGGWSPAYSPDGKQIVYSMEDGLYVAKSDGSKRRRILGGPNFEPDWQRREPDVVLPAPVPPAPVPVQETPVPETPVPETPVPETPVPETPPPPAGTDTNGQSGGATPPGPGAPQGPGSPQGGILGAGDSSQAASLSRRPVTLRRGRAVVRIACDGPRTRQFAGTLRLRSAQPVRLGSRRVTLDLGSARVACDGGETVRVSVKPPARSARALRRLGRLRTTATLTLKTDAGRSAGTASATLTLRAR